MSISDVDSSIVTNLIVRSGNPDYILHKLIYIVINQSETNSHLHSVSAHHSLQDDHLPSKFLVKNMVEILLTISRLCNAIIM